MTTAAEIGTVRVSRRAALGLAGLGAATAALGGFGRVAHATSEAEADPSLQGAGFYRMRLGEFDLFLISDGAFRFEDPQAVLASDTGAPEFDDALREAFLRSDQVMGQVNTLLVRTPHATVLVDAGCGELFGPATGKLLSNMARAGFKPGDIDAVVLTHAHPDHFGGIVGGGAADAFAKARFFVSRDEHDFWRGPAPDLSRSPLPKPMLDQFIQGANAAFDAMKPPLDLIGDKDQIAPGVHAMLLGGHTPGHIGLRIASGSEELVYVSDLVHHVSFGMTHPEWRVAFDYDPEEGSRVRRRVLDRIASDRAFISGSHLPFPAFGHVRQRGKGFEFAPTQWIW